MSASSPRRASIRTELGASSRAVFSHSSDGIPVVIQSFESPRRTMKALVSAAKNITTAASSTISPVMEARREAPRPPDEPSPWPESPPGGLPPPFQISVVTELAILLMSHCPGHQRRIGLHDVILRSAWYAVFVGAVVDHRMHAGEIIEWRRRWDGPFESRRFPRIHRRLRALFHAPEQIH